MKREELEHNLSVLVEVKLYQMLEVIKEIPDTFEYIEREQQKAIIDFINGLPENYKNMPNRDEIIANVLSRMGLSNRWVRKKLEEIACLKKAKQTNISNEIKQEER